MLLHPARISKIYELNFHSFVQNNRDLFLPFESVQLFFGYFLTGITLFITVTTVVFVNTLFFLIVFTIAVIATFSVLAACFLHFLTASTRRRRILLFSFMFDLFLLFFNDRFFLLFFNYFCFIDTLFLLNLISNNINCNRILFLFFLFLINLVIILYLFNVLHFHRLLLLANLTHNSCIFIFSCYYIPDCSCPCNSRISFLFLFLLFFFLLIFFRILFRSLL